MKPLVSVVVPCYNQGLWLSETLLSVFKQTYESWECIVVNDGSSDNTDLVIEKWCSKDERFKGVKQANLGVSVARNKGISTGKGTIILCLDADDLISEDYLELALEVFSNNPKLSLVYCQAEKFGKQSGRWDLPTFTIKRLARSNIIFNAAFFKKDDWKRLGGYDENMKEGLEDWEFWINLLKEHGLVYQIPKVCFYYRIHSGSRNRGILGEHYKKLHDYISEKHINFYIENIGNYPRLIKKIENLERDHEALKHSKKNALRVILNSFNFLRSDGKK